MDDTLGNKNKPLKSTINPQKGIMDTYKKNDKTRNIPISDGDRDYILNELEKADDMKIENNEKSNEPDSKLDEYKVAFDELNKQINDHESEKIVLQKERDDFREQLQRKMAEFENFRRRSLKEKEDLINYANEGLLRKLLEILDDINAAVDSSKKTNDLDSLVMGLGMILQKTNRIFEDNGVKPMESPVGKDFDYNLQEALMATPSDLPENQVVQELQRGYTIFDKVLRHARVITSSGSN